MRYRGGGVGHKSTQHATNTFLKDWDPLDYAGEDTDLLSYDEGSGLAGQFDNNDEDILELSDKEGLQVEEEDDEEEGESEYQYHSDEVDGQCTMEEELGFSPL